MGKKHTVELLESYDNFAPLRNGLRGIAEEKEHWAGIPMPLTDLELVVEPKFPNAVALSEIGKTGDPLPEDVKVRNVFWSNRLRAEIYIWEEAGKIQWGVVPLVHGASFELSTLSSSDAWGIEQESNAIHKLGELLNHRRFKQYLLTGTFLETSRSSGIVYMFRKLRPTIAIRADEKGGRILCCLCLHPIAYYGQTWAGAMCPTDDVIAHLMLMRGDEIMFWKRANQHPPHRPEAGL